MRLLFLTDGLWPHALGGIQRHSTLLVGQLVARSEQLTVVYCGAPGEPPPDPQKMGLAFPQATCERIEWVPVVFPKCGRLPGHYIRESRKYSRRIVGALGDLSRFDACYAQGLTGLSLLGSRLPVMVNLHGLNMFQVTRSPAQWLVKRMFQPAARQILRADAVVSLGGDLTRILIDSGCESSRIVTLPNGLDVSELLENSGPSDTLSISTSPASPRFILIGRHEQAKGFDVLTAALAEMDLAIDLDLVGEWPALVSPPHRIVHHGVVMDREKLLQLMDSADVLLSPSHSEGMPTVILEAMARGLAVVATDVGAVGELVNDSTGWLVPAGDANAFAKAVTCAAWAQASTREAMGRKARENVEQYLWPQVAEQTMAALEKMVKTGLESD